MTTSVIPVVLFVFLRPEHTRSTLEALSRNFLSSSVALYIYSDGPRSDEEIKLVEEVRAICMETWPFFSVSRVESATNIGLANSIIKGVSETLSRHDSAIVLEDDILTSRNFLDFMHQALSFYKGNKSIANVSGFSTYLGDSVDATDFYLSPRLSSWGWATWRDRWEMINWDTRAASSDLRNWKQRIRMRSVGSDFSSMLDAQVKGKIDSWAVRFLYFQWKHGLVSVAPTRSKCQNFGFDESATHTFDHARFDTRLDHSGQRSFTFNAYPYLDRAIARASLRPFSLQARLISNLRLYFRRILHFFRK